MNAPHLTANLKKSGIIAGLIFWLPVLSASIFAVFVADNLREIFAAFAIGALAVFSLFLLLGSFLPQASIW